MEKKLIKEAIDSFGYEVVNQVFEMMELTNPDDAYNIFNGKKMFTHSKCVEFLYLKK
jgi:hypothetical protein